MHAVFFLHGNIRAGANLVMLRHAVFLAGSARVSVVFQHDWFGADVSFVPGHQASPPVPLRDYAPDAPADVAVTNWWTCAYDFPLIPARRYVYYRQGNERALYDTPIFDALLGWIDQERFAWACVNARPLARPLQRAGHAPLLLPPGVDLARFRTAPSALPPRRERLRVLVEGPLDAPHKRVAATLATLRGIEGVETVHMAADGSRADAGLALGAVPHADVAGVYAGCDLLLKLSALESFAMPVLEQFAAGGTAIVAAFPGHEQLIEPGRNALLVDPADPFPAARDAVLALRDDPARLAALRRAAAATAERFDWPPIHARFAAFLEQPAGAAVQPLPVAEAYRACLAETVALWGRDAARRS